MKDLHVGDAGADVAYLQKLLDERGYTLVVDGHFGAHTGAAIVEAKHALGYRSNECLPVAGDRFVRLVTGTRRPLRWSARIVVRRVRPNRNAVIRGKIVAFLRWGVVNAAQIHYAEIRPIPHVQPGRLPALPFTTDCSGFYTMACQWAGAPDPNRNSFGGQGYTGTLLRFALTIVGLRRARPGDAIVYGLDTGKHVAGIVEAGADPLTVSHGQESDPAFVRVSQDGRQPQRVCQYLA